MAAFKGDWWNYSSLKSAVNDAITDHPATNISSTTFASLPSAATGANKVPVFSDGAAWKVG
jgi:hypothetical protein